MVAPPPEGENRNIDRFTFPEIYDTVHSGMGDIRVLREQIEIGVPLESAAILAGFEFDEIEALEDDDTIQRMVALADAQFMSRHLVNIATHSDVNPRMSAWLLERRFPAHFSPTSKIVEPKDVPKSVVVRGVHPRVNSDEEESQDDRR